MLCVTWATFVTNLKELIIVLSISLSIKNFFLFFFFMSFFLTFTSLEKCVYFLQPFQENIFRLLLRGLLRGKKLYTRYTIKRDKFLILKRDLTQERYVRRLLISLVCPCRMAHLYLGVGIAV